MHLLCLSDGDASSLLSLASAEVTLMLLSLPVSVHDAPPPPPDGTSVDGGKEGLGVSRGSVGMLDEALCKVVGYGVPTVVFVETVVLVGTAVGNFVGDMLGVAVVGELDSADDGVNEGEGDDNQSNPSKIPVLFTSLP